MEKRKHGDQDKREDTAPSIGNRIDGNTVSIHRVPACSYEVHFQADCDTIPIITAPVIGMCRFDSDRNVDYRAQPFKAYFHPAGSSTYAEATATGEFFAIHADASVREAYAEDTKQSKLLGSLDVRTDLSFSNSQALITYLRHAFAGGFVGGKLQAESLGLLIYAEVMAAISKTGAKTPRRTTLSDARLSQVLELIETRLDGGAGLSELAAAVDLSAYHFARAFKSATGLSPHAYVIERRLARARELLTKPDAVLADVAYAVGFSSQAHMTDVFRKKLGVTPGQFRTEISK